MNNTTSDPARLERQIRFILELDRLKQVYRRSYLLDTSRKENSAEHSWHLAVMALLLREYAPAAEIDLLRVVGMALAHDLVEIDAGDTFIYDADQSIKKAKETEAAERIFGLLPPDQAEEFRALWDEYEARATPESRYLHAIDRLEPLLLNFHTQGKAWREHGITADRVMAVNRGVVTDGSPELGAYVVEMIREAERRGYVLPDAGGD